MKRERFNFDITNQKWTPVGAQNLDIADFTVEELYRPFDFEGDTTIGIKARAIDSHKIISTGSRPTFCWDKHSFHITISKEDYDDLEPITGQIYFIYTLDEPRYSEQPYGEIYNDDTDLINYAIREIARKKSQLQG